MPALARIWGSIAERLGFVNEPAGGIGFDFGIYLTTEMVALLGPATEVCGIAQTRFPDRVHRDISHREFGCAYRYNNEDTMIGSIQFANGATGAIASQWKYDHGGTAVIYDLWY